MADHTLTNIKVRRESGINTMKSYIELRRARWLEKIANMNSNRSVTNLGARKTDLHNATIGRNPKDLRTNLNQ